MLKPASQDMQEAICECIFGPLCRRALGSSSPNIITVQGANKGEFYTGSKYLAQPSSGKFSTIMDLSPETRGLLPKAKGGAAAFATALMFGNVDMNKGNVGILRDPSSNDVTIATLDYGRAGRDLAVDPYIIGMNLLGMYKKYKDLFPINKKEFTDKITSLTDTFTDDIIKAHVRKGIDLLKQTGAVPDVSYYFFDNNADKKEHLLGPRPSFWRNPETGYLEPKPPSESEIKERWENLEIFLIDGLVKRREALKQLGSALEQCHFTGTDIAQSATWMNGGWLNEKTMAEMEKHLLPPAQAVNTVSTLLPTNLLTEEQGVGFAPSASVEGGGRTVSNSRKTKSNGRSF